MRVYRVKKRKRSKVPNCCDWVEGSPEHMRAQGKVILVGAKSKRVLPDAVRGPGTKSHRTQVFCLYLK